MRVAVDTAEGAVGDESESDEDEAEEQPSLVRTDQVGGGERRPRRRGRRGGRRRRGGGPDEGLVGSIADELAPPPAPEATSAVADFDSESAEPSPSIVEHESIAQPPTLQPAADHGQPEITARAQEEAAHEAERAARRRSTVREKVSFLTSAQPDAAPPPGHSSPEPATPTAPAEPAPASSNEAQPRKAGWWSRRFGGGE
jgi:ribonuclease E